MAQVRGFPPIADAGARVLILGSMPGKASLDAREYYAHPRNLFWPILCELIGARPDLPYAGRVRALNARGIAVWDVLESCVREGSLDADIDEATIRVNDFAAFYRSHPRIAAVFFNGAKAEACYRKHVLPRLGDRRAPLHYQRLPSTSPAHAAMSYLQKRSAWKAVIERLRSDRMAG